MNKEYNDYYFCDYYAQELDGINYFTDGDGYRDEDGIYYDEDELVEQEWDNFTDWADEQDERSNVVYE